MANKLSRDKKILAVSALCEGSSIRSIERMTGVHRDTIMRLGVRMGDGCSIIMDEKMRNLDCRNVEVDEIWGFIGKKQKNVMDEDLDKGDIWTFISLDRDTKLIPSFRVGNRDGVNANAFIEDLALRMKNRIQLSTDSLLTYLDAVDKGFAGQVDYGQVVKTFSQGDVENQRKYSPPKVVSVTRKTIVGNPEESKICTSHIEKQNHTLRMHCRRLSRLTNAFSKKLENFKAAVAMNFVYYNFAKVHGSIRCTPAQEAGIESSMWTVSDMVEMIEG